jgi:hypothetical protein
MGLERLRRLRQSYDGDFSSSSFPEEKPALFPRPTRNHSPMKADPQQFKEIPFPSSSNRNIIQSNRTEDKSLSFPPPPEVPAQKLSVPQPAVPQAPPDMNDFTVGNIQERLQELNELQDDDEVLEEEEEEEEDEAAISENEDERKKENAELSNQPPIVPSTSDLKSPNELQSSQIQEEDTKPEDLEKLLLKDSRRFIPDLPSSFQRDPEDLFASPGSSYPSLPNNNATAPLNNNNQSNYMNSNTPSLPYSYQNNYNSLYNGNPNNNNNYSNNKLPLNAFLSTGNNLNPSSTSKWEDKYDSFMAQRNRNDDLARNNQRFTDSNLGNKNLYSPIDSYGSINIRHQVPTSISINFDPTTKNSNNSSKPEKRIVFGDRVDTLTNSMDLSGLSLQVRVNFFNLFAPSTYKLFFYIENSRAHIS